MTFQIIENSATSIVATIKGELDTLASQQFEADLQPLLDQAEKQFLLDFTEVTFISSSAMRVILTLKKATAVKGGRIAIKGMTPALRQIFELTHFDRVVDIL